MGARGIEDASIVAALKQHSAPKVVQMWKVGVDWNPAFEDHDESAAKLGARASLRGIEAVVDVMNPGCGRPDPGVSVPIADKAVG